MSSLVWQAMTWAAEWLLLVLLAPVLSEALAPLMTEIFWTLLLLGGVALGVVVLTIVLLIGQVRKVYRSEQPTALRSRG